MHLYLDLVDPRFRDLSKESLINSSKYFYCVIPSRIPSGVIFQEISTKVPTSIWIPPGVPCEILPSSPVVPSRILPRAHPFRDLSMSFFRGLSENFFKDSSMSSLRDSFRCSLEIFFSGRSFDYATFGRSLRRFLYNLTLGFLEKFLQGLLQEFHYRFL